MGNDTKHYVAFIQEEYFKKGEIINWRKNELVANAQGKITELYAYWDKDMNETIWKTVDY